jgi:hypothetical protein
VDGSPDDPQRPWHADPRFDALAALMTSPRGWLMLPGDDGTSRTNDGQMIKGLAAIRPDRLRRAGLCHLGFLPMKLILVARTVAIVMAIN